MLVEICDELKQVKVGCALASTGGAKAINCDSGQRGFVQRIECLSIAGITMGLESLAEPVPQDSALATKPSRGVQVLSNDTGNKLPNRFIMSFTER